MGALAGLLLEPSFPALVPRDDLEPDRPRSEPSAWGLRVAFVAGAAALASEVVWERMVGLLLGATTYAFTAMLLAVLLGIAIGGRLGGALADDALRTGASPRTRTSERSAPCASRWPTCAPATWAARARPFARW